MAALKLYFGDLTQALSRAATRDLRAVLIIFLLPLVTHLPSLCGWLSTNPIHFVSGLASFRGKQMLPGYPWIDPTVGTYAQALGKLSADEWLSGKIPWWNYYTGIGVPLAAEMSPAAFFLPFVLLNHFSNGLLYISIAMQILAGLGTYYLLRRIGLIHLAATTGAILYQFCGVFTWLGAPVSSTIPFLPWLILGIEHATEKCLTRSSGGWLLVTISLAFSIYAGFPEISYINGLLAATWALWRLFTIPFAVRFRLIKKLATGVIVGLLLSMPAIIPFFEFCRYSYLGNHTFDAGFGGLRGEAFPQLFFPWLYGGIWTYSDDANVMWTVWATVGGYLSATQLAVIILGVFTTRRRGITTILLLWIVICLGRAFALPFISALVDFVPLLKLVNSARYAPQSWEFCGALLCAIIINDAHVVGFYPRRKFMIRWLAPFLIATISLYQGRELVAHFYAQESYRMFLWISLIWGFSNMLIVVLAFWFGKEHNVIAGHTIAIILVVDSIALFSVPFFSAVNRGQSKSLGVEYLKRHIGTDRFYTLGPVSPNYGAYYRIASINHNYLPIATSWVRYIKDHLDPYSNPVCFTGNFQRSDDKVPNQAEVLRENIAQYKRIGVRYVLTPHSDDPFERTASLVLSASNNTPFNLKDGQRFYGNISGKQFVGNRISAIRILVGNYSGKSDGMLKVRLCADGFCVVGERSLQESDNNRPFLIPLNQPITFTTGEIQYEISHSGGSFPVVVWIWPQKDGQQAHNSVDIPSGYAPRLEFVHARDQSEERPLRVFESNDMDIYELSGVSPYFDLAQGDAHLRIKNRSAVSLSCSSEAQLIRRELYYPGWKAFIGGKSVPIEPYNDIFQAIRIPPGQYEVTFAYAPTHMPLISALFLFGTLWLTIGAMRGRNAIPI